MLRSLMLPGDGTAACRPSRIRFMGWEPVQKEPEASHEALGFRDADGRLLHRCFAGRKRNQARVSLSTGGCPLESGKSAVIV